MMAAGAMGFHHVQEEPDDRGGQRRCPGNTSPAHRRLRATVLGPRGGGTTRRRASDAFRLGLAVIVVTVSVPVMRANSAVELSIVRALTPPPAAIRWLVTSVFWLGSAGVIALLVIVALLVPRLAAVRWTALAAVLTWGCVPCWRACSDRRRAGRRSPRWPG